MQEPFDTEEFWDGAGRWEWSDTEQTFVCQSGDGRWWKWERGGFQEIDSLEHWVRRVRAEDSSG